jgi:predicted membrane protein (TIGR00267 family)
MKRMDAGPSVRRFFINTLFDSTFMLLGVIVGSAFVLKPELQVIMGTMILSSVALGISTGVSVYEAESLERERRIQELEKAMLTNLDNTVITASARKAAILVASINLLTPLFMCIICTIPFTLVYLETVGIKTAAWTSISVALVALLFAGIYMGRYGKGNALLKGAKMAALGGLTFLIVYLLGTSI